MDDGSLIEIGYSFLVKHYALNIIPHYRASYITQTGRGSTSLKQNQPIYLH